MKKILLILLLFACPAFADPTEESLLVDSVGTNEFTLNGRDCDNHMYWDGTSLWLVSTEWAHSSCTGGEAWEASGQNLVKFNPTLRTYTKYTLAAIGGGNQIVYSVMPNPAGTHMYICGAAYGSPLGAWQFEIGDDNTVASWTLTDWTEGYGGKLIVTNDGTDDVVWTTNGLQRKIGKSIIDASPALNATFTVPEADAGTYGITATRTSTANKWNIYVCTWGGKLYIIDSDVDDLTEDSITVDFADITDNTNFGLFDAHYDGDFIWISARSHMTTTAGVAALIRYRPSLHRKTAGTYEIFYTNSSTAAQDPVSVRSRGRYVYMSGEIHYASTSTRYLVRFDKIDETFTYIPITTIGTYQREMTSVEVLDNGEVWLGGYGWCAVSGSTDWRLTRVYDDQNPAWMK